MNDPTTGSDDYRSDLIGKLDRSEPGDVGPRLEAIHTAFLPDRPEDADECAAFRGAVSNSLRALGFSWRAATERAAKAIPDPRVDDGGDAEGKPPLISLADLDIDDSLPEWCGWLIGCPGRLVLLHGRWKGGKSTFMEGGVAAITRGREWLGRATKEGSVLLCTEMHTGDVKRTLRQFDADLARVYVCRPEDLSEHVQRAPEDLVLVVVDTLTTYAEAIGITKLSDPITAKTLMMTLRRAVFGTRPDVSLARAAPQSQGAGRGRRGRGPRLDRHHGRRRPGDLHARWREGRPADHPPTARDGPLVGAWRNRAARR